MSKYSNIDSLSVESNRMFAKRSFNDNQKITDDRIETHIRSVLNRVNTDKIRQNLTRISKFHTRHSKSPLLNDAGDWIMNQLQRVRLQGYFLSFL